MMKPIIYLGNSNNKAICRDACEKYAKSLDLIFMNLGSWIENPMINPEAVYIIDSGWKTSLYINEMECAMNLLNTNGLNWYLRIVDDTNGYYNNLDCELFYLIRKYNPKLISPYKHHYFNRFDTKVIPYHIDNIIDGTHERGVILSGLNDEYYPLRHSLYELPTKPSWFEILNHPGYSGRCWNTGKLGNDYVSYMAEYKIMIVTTATDFELLKYAECAEAGCCPLGEFPTSLLDIMPKSLHALHCESATEVIRLADWILSHGDLWRDYANAYRNFMIENRSKYKILTELQSL